MPDDVFDQPISEAAAQLGVHIDTVRAWAEKGLLPAMRSGGNRWRFSKARNAEFIAGRLNQPAAEASA